MRAWLVIVHYCGNDVPSHWICSTFTRAREVARRQVEQASTRGSSVEEFDRGVDCSSFESSDEIAVAEVRPYEVDV